MIDLIEVEKILLYLRRAKEADRIMVCLDVEYILSKLSTNTDFDAALVQMAIESKKNYDELTKLIQALDDNKCGEC